MDFRARFAHSYCGSAVIEMPSWECRLRCARAVETHQRQAASASICIIHNAAVLYLHYL